MVSKPNTKSCASKDNGLSSEMDFEFLHWLERETKLSLKERENLSLVYACILKP